MEDNEKPTVASAESTGTPADAPKVVKKSHRKVLILAAGLSLLAAAAAAYVLVIKKDTASDTTNSGNESSKTVQNQTLDSFMPRIDRVASVAEFDGATWYATTGAVVKVSDDQVEYFSNAQGIPEGSPNSLVVHNNKLWVSTLAGVSIYNPATGTFEPFTNGLPGEMSNGKLFYDTVAKQLYMNDFAGFYALVNDDSLFEPVVGPANVLDFVANETYVSVYSSVNPDWPVWTYNKSNKEWVKNTPDLEQQSYQLITVDGDIVVFGRSKGYVSCESAGSVAATSAFRLTDEGAWQPFAQFNADKTREELSAADAIAPGGSPRLAGSSCGGSATYSYSVAIKDDELVLGDEQEITPNGAWGENAEEQAELVKKLLSATKRHAAIQLYDIDGQGNFVYLYTDDASSSSTAYYSGIAVAKNGLLADSTNLDLASIDQNINVPILCGSGESRKLTYVFSGMQHYAVNSQEGFPDGTWENAAIYSIEDTKITKLVDVDKNIAAPRFSCSDTELRWLGTNSFMTMDRATDKVSKLGQDLSVQPLGYDNTTVNVSQSGAMWAGLINEESTSSDVFYLDSKNSDIKEVLEDSAITSIVGSTDTHFVGYGSPQKDPFTALFNAAGEELRKISTNSYGPPVFTSVGASDFVFVLDDTSAGVFKPFSFQKMSVDADPISLATNSTSYTSRYGTTNGDGFSPIISPGLLFDSSRNMLWLNDDLFGVSSFKL